ncbi:MAG: Gfo/Idh/MocA family oxidoreductase [Opitutaceae bacterium]|jgi:predicted dehydrogenase|nr:Gfo/Idh/MocA family oxidoreductase [Opitutaceae bacterium]
MTPAAHPDDFRICLIGCGHHARIAHGPSLKKYREENPGVVLAAACDTNPDAVRAFAADFGFASAHTDVSEMLRREKPHALSVVLPPVVAPQICAPLLEQGMPLLIEKPPALTSAILERLIVSATQGRAPHAVAFNRRHTPIVAVLRNLLDETLPPEDVFHIDYEMIRHARRDSDFSTTAIHAIDTLCYLARSPVTRARFSYTDLPDIGRGVANIEMNAETRHGPRLRLNAQPVAGLIVERISVNARDHSFFLELPMWGEDLTGRLHHWHCGKLVFDSSISPPPFSPPSLIFQCGFYEENRVFFNALRQKRVLSDSSPTLTETRQQIRLMEAVHSRAEKLEF